MPNFVSPAYDLANVAPKYIDFKRGGFIAAIAAIVVLPWKIFANAVAVNYFLGGLAAFLGPLFGIIVVDYYLIKRQQVNVDDLYREGEVSPYWYQGGINVRAVVAFVISAATHRRRRMRWSSPGFTRYYCNLQRKPSLI